MPRYPIGEEELGYVTKSQYSDYYYFVLTTRDWVYKNDSTRIMTYATFKERFPYGQRYNHYRTNVHPKSKLKYYPSLINKENRKEEPN